MRKPLTIAVAQPLTLSHDLAHNVRRHAEAVRAANARVVVFPELSLTGYEMDAKPVSLVDERLHPLARACGKTDSVALVGAPTDRADGTRYISVLAVSELSIRLLYHKKWLGEAEVAHFAPGSRPGFEEVDDWWIAMAVCKDTGVPEHAAAAAALGMDVYAAGVLESADDAEVQPERARRVARDHGVWVAIASFAGSTGGGYDPAAGGSAIWRPDGTIAAQAGRAPGEFARATITDTRH